MSFIEDIVNQVQKWPVSVAMVVALALFGVVLKKVESFPNRYISLAIVAPATLLYVLIGERGSISPTVDHPNVVLGIYGSILGAIAWLAHGVIYKQIIQRLPGIKNSNDTDIKPRKDN